MQNEKLLRMANQIASGLRRRAAPEQAIAQHINDFWEPRMRAALLGMIEGGASGVDPLLKQAVPYIRPAETA